MSYKKEWEYHVNDFEENITSSQGANRKIYAVSESVMSSYIEPSKKYYNPISQGMNIFGNVIGGIIHIKNDIVRQKLILFVNEFTAVLERIQRISNLFPPLVFMEDEDSVFLEWVFKDFRIGFTFCENEDESMWFMISNRNLEELSISGDLRISDYYAIIIKVLGFVVENT